MGETEVTTGMTAFITALTEGLSADALWGAIAPIAPLIIVFCLVGFGLYVLRKNLRKGTKGKGGTV